MSLSDFRRALLIVFSSALLALLVAAYYVRAALRFPDTAAGDASVEAKIVVEKGIALGEIARRLAARDIIVHPSWFRIYANERGLAQKIRAGHYAFSAAMTPRQILEKLVEGVPVEEISVTIPEGKNIIQIAELFNESGITSKDDIIKLARDPAFAKQQKVPGITLEGYLFPDTYRFQPGTPASRVLAAMVKRQKAVIEQVKAENPKGVENIKTLFGFGDRELVLMASLVEKETGRAEERPRIAAVFYNRLRLPTFVPHRLETDPTIIYGCTVPLEKSEACKKFEGRIRRIHLEDKDNAYNTYTHEGLPPGPISNPGRAALEAVVKPEDTAYLFFVSKNDGTHYFSKNKTEHEAAVDKYQRNKSP